MHIDFNAQSAIQSANNPVSKCQNGTLKFSIINILKIDGQDIKIRIHMPKI